MVVTPQRTRSEVHKREVDAAIKAALMTKAMLMPDEVLDRATAARDRWQSTGRLISACQAFSAAPTRTSKAGESLQRVAQPATAAAGGPSAAEAYSQSPVAACANPQHVPSACRCNLLDSRLANAAAPPAAAAPAAAVPAPLPPPPHTLGCSKSWWDLPVSSSGSSSRASSSPSFSGTAGGAGGGSIDDDRQEDEGHEDAAAEEADAEQAGAEDEDAADDDEAHWYYIDKEDNYVGPVSLVRVRLRVRVRVRVRVRLGQSNLNPNPRA